jgi:hypothetical protein
MSISLFIIIYPQYTELQGLIINLVETKSLKKSHNKNDQLFFNTLQDSCQNG